MSEDTQVWCSNFLGNTNAYIIIDIDEPAPWPDGHWVHRRLTCDKISPEELPETFTLRTEPLPVPEAAPFGFGLAIGERVKTLLEGFALGETQIIPIRVVDRFGNPSERPVYLLNIAECRSLVVPKQCKGAVRVAPTSNVWWVPDANRGLDLAVRGGSRRDWIFGSIR